MTKISFADWVKAAVGVAMFMLAGSAMADETWYVIYGTTKPLYTSPLEACQKKASTGHSHYVTQTDAVTWRCYYTLPPPNPQTPTSGSTIKLRTLPDCPPGQVRNQETAVCETVPQCPASSTPIVKRLFVGTKPNTKVPSCDPVCQMEVVEIIDCFSYPEGTNPNGVWCDFKYTKPGGECAGGGEEPPEVNDMAGDPADEDFSGSSNDDSGSCPAGTTQGGVDSSGIPVCMGSGTAPDAPKAPPTQTKEAPSTTTNADGSSTTTEVTRQTNADGSETTVTKTTTTNPDGSVTTATDVSVTNSSSGGAGRTDTDPADDKYDLCKTNPNLTVCKNSTVAGACEQTSCTGDAIQCATLRAAAIMECRQRKNEEDLTASPLHALGQSAIAGTDKDGLPTIENASVFNVPGSLDQSGFIGAGSCFADKTITVQGHTVTIPFSQACDILLVLRYAIMVVAALVSFRILSGAVLKD